MLSRSQQQTNRCPDDDPVEDEIVEIDRSVFAERARYVCPRGHIGWIETSDHLWCHGCYRQAEAGTDVEPKHQIVYDKKSGRTIPWGRIRIVQ